MSSVFENNLKMYVSTSENKLAVKFSDDFYIHSEAVETINLFMDNFVAAQPLTESLVGDVVKWFNNYLGLCFETGLATTIYRPDFVKLEGAKNEG